MNRTDRLLGPVVRGATGRSAPDLELAPLSYRSCPLPATRRVASPAGGTSYSWFYLGCGWGSRAGELPDQVRASATTLAAAAMGVLSLSAPSTSFVVMIEMMSGVPSGVQVMATSLAEP